MLTLYYAPKTCALATHIALADAQAEYSLRRVDFARGEQREADYAKINPKGRVPALVTPRGVLTETPALLAYVAQSFPQARLARLDDPHAFAEMQAVLSYFASTVHVAHAHRPRAERWAATPEAQADLRAKAPANMRDCFALIEREMFRGPWVMGKAYSVADPYLFTVASWLPFHEIDVAAYPRVADHFRRMGERESVRRALREAA